MRTSLNVCSLIHLKKKNITLYMHLLKWRWRHTTRVKVAFVSLFLFIRSLFPFIYIYIYALINVLFSRRRRIRATASACRFPPLPSSFNDSEQHRELRSFSVLFFIITYQSTAKMNFSNARNQSCGRVIIRLYLQLLHKHNTLFQVVCLPSPMHCSNQPTSRSRPAVILLRKTSKLVYYPYNRIMHAL